MDPLKQREKDFHDQAFAGDVRKEVKRFYSITQRAGAHYKRLLADSHGKRVLEFGCGRGSQAYGLSQGGASVVGIDISPVAIEQATARARELGLAHITFREDDAEHLSFEDGSFDLVCGSGILHHLDLRAALSELARVTRPDGSCVFFEPLGHNPLINRFRNRTPKLRTPDEHPLLMSDLRLAEEYFGSVQAWYYHLSTLLAIPWRGKPGFHGLVKGLDALDHVLFKGLPFLRKHAWIVVLRFSEPRK